MSDLHINSQEHVLNNGSAVTVRRAGANDLEGIRSLYFGIYGNNYPVADIVDPEIAGKNLQKLNDILWIVAECRGQIVGSTIYAVDPYHRIGKAFGAAVSNDFRGQGLISLMMKPGLDRLIGDNGPCDQVYATVRTFISPEFHKRLGDLGFVDTGIFPNIHKVREYETHGFIVCPSPHAYKYRRPLPRIYNQLNTLYHLVSSRLGLDQASIVKNLDMPAPDGQRIKLKLMTPEEIAQEFPQGIEGERERLRQEGKLRFGFYPLVGPNMVITNADRSVKAFLSWQKMDGNCVLVGLETGQHNMVTLLESISMACEELGVTYLELLASAYDPMLQAQLWQAYFLPCGWFPAARIAADGMREDYVVVSRTFVPLHFKGLKLTEESKPFLLEFFNLYTSRLWEELVQA